jgi:hypothetical protein
LNLSPAWTKFSGATARHASIAIDFFIQLSTLIN